MLAIHWTALSVGSSRYGSARDQPIEIAREETFPRWHVSFFETILDDPAGPSPEQVTFSTSVCNPRTIVHRTSVTRCVVTAVREGEKRERNKERKKERERKREKEIERGRSMVTQWQYKATKEKDEEAKRRVQVPRVVETHRQTVGETGGAAQGSGLERAREKGTCSRHAAEGRLVGVGERGVSVCVYARESGSLAWLLRNPRPGVKSEMTTRRESGGGSRVSDYRWRTGCSQSLDTILRARRDS